MRHPLAATLSATVLALVMPTGASASVTTSVRVSGPSPYASCASSDAGQSGSNYVNAEVEPSVAVNPTDPGNRIAMYHQDRWSNGGAHGIGGAFTNDGGASWTYITLPCSSCAPGGVPYLRASDPWVSFGPDGTAYASALSFEFTDGRNAVTATVSHDGGATWTDTQTLVAYPNSQLFTDKNATTAD